jgi:hypothetical protein
MPCCDSTPAMVATAIKTPAAEVFGFFQIFEIKFMRFAPGKEKGGSKPPQVELKIDMHGRRSICFGTKKSRPVAVFVSDQPLVSMDRISPNSSATVVAVLARGGEPLRRRPETVPSPGTLHCRRANTFAGPGTSVSCLATYKPRHSCLFIRQESKKLQLLMDHRLARQHFEPAA